LEINVLAKNLGRFIVLLFFQVLFLNNISATSLNITPFLYVLFILMLPYETKGWLALILAFLMGLSVDIFSDTGGTHAAAGLLIALIRPLVLSAFATRDGYESGTEPRLSNMGFVWILKYTLLMVFIHHITLFTIDAFSFHNYMLTLLRVSVTVIFSTLLIILSHLLFFRN
jgi:rod shape-determining protein MreD